MVRKTASHGLGGGDLVPGQENDPVSTVTPTAVFTLPDVQARVVPNDGAPPVLERRISDSVKVTVVKDTPASMMTFSSGGDNRAPDGQKKQETALAIALQVCLPFLVAGMGMVGAGIYLDVVQVTENDNNEIKHDSA